MIRLITLDSILLPLVTALGAAVENSGRLIARADLNFHEKGALAAAIAYVWTLHRSNVSIFKSFSPSKNVVHLLSLQSCLVFKLRFDAINVRAAAAKEPKVICRLLSQ